MSDLVVYFWLYQKRFFAEFHKFANEFLRSYLHIWLFVFKNFRQPSAHENFCYM